jgi:hypothetical protein
MDKQRIETHGTGAGFGDRLCRSKGDAVRGALDEALEGIAGIERRTEQRSRDRLLFLKSADRGDCMMGERLRRRPARSCRYDCVGVGACEASS